MISGKTCSRIGFGGRTNYSPADIVSSGTVTAKTSTPGVVTAVVVVSPLVVWHNDRDEFSSSPTTNESMGRKKSRKVGISELRCAGNKL